MTKWNEVTFFCHRQSQQDTDIAHLCGHGNSCCMSMSFMVAFMKENSDCWDWYHAVWSQSSVSDWKFWHSDSANLGRLHREVRKSDQKIPMKLDAKSCYLLKLLEMYSWYRYSYKPKILTDRNLDRSRSRYRPTSVHILADENGIAYSIFY